MKYALGLVEAIGMGTAIEAADAALKSANIALLGFEPCRGDGMQTLKLLGEVGAVKAAVAAAEAACSNGRGCFSVTIIARPHEQLEPFINNDLTVGADQPKTQIPRVVLEDLYNNNPPGQSNQDTDTDSDVETEVEEVESDVDQVDTDTDGENEDE